MTSGIDLRPRKILTVLAVIFGIGVPAVFIFGCDALVGPATTEFKCPVYCGKSAAGADICCSYPLTCSRYADKPCAAPEYQGAGRGDAGPG